MQNDNEFRTVFVNSPGALKMGIKLRQLVFEHFDQVNENIYGGAKVKLALYSREGKNNVLCGIQQSGEACMLYVHHIDKIDHKRLTFSGKGKHAKRIKFTDIEEILDEDIHWLFSLVQSNVPY